MKSKGFTLIEFVMVIAIVGTLSIMAIPVYRKYIEKNKNFSKKYIYEKSLN
ncbi:MAG: prepilin-type N-terminal cleavage/methylation domain-containing protein [Endomicrobium sp.]|jgi:prepilin-type N-terminal cleavage/methylation domain-containing protein|nr:prepilin-type N-terminal cleavage/methylation domain-containing protein [Endomicrobium sp.]